MISARFAYDGGHSSHRYAEISRAQLFDASCYDMLKEILMELAGSTAERLEASITDFGDIEEVHHPEELFITRQQYVGRSRFTYDLGEVYVGRRALFSNRHSKTALNAAAAAEKEKELSASKQRDQKIYLTQVCN